MGPSYLTDLQAEICLLWTENSNTEKKILRRGSNIQQCLLTCRYCQLMWRVKITEVFFRSRHFHIRMVLQPPIIKSYPVINISHVIWKKSYRNLKNADVQSCLRPLGCCCRVRSVWNRPYGMT